METTEVKIEETKTTEQPIEAVVKKDKKEKEYHAILFVKLLNMKSKMFKVEEILPTITMEIKPGIPLVFKLDGTRKWGKKVIGHYCLEGE